MFPSFPRAIIAAILGAAAGAGCLTAAFARNPALVLDLGVNLPRLTSGFHPVERDGDLTFAWTGASAAVALPGLDRRTAWTCAIRARGSRPAGFEQPLVDVDVDGITSASRRATNEYEDVVVSVPPRLGRPGLTLTIRSVPTFVPGSSDRRQLGVQVDRIACGPDGLVFPPRPALATAVLAGAVFAAAFALIGIPLGWAALGALVLSAVQAFPLARGPALYSAFPDQAAALAIWISIALVGVAACGRRLAGRRLHRSARFVLAFSAGVLFLHLLALLHPEKPLVDAVFHAHRLGWVLDGRLLFTQPMPDGVRFPYAIGLYVFAAPWAAITADHVLLLRVVVSAAHVTAGALLYPAVGRAWGSRPAGAAAVVLYHAAPLPYVVIGNANMTFAFGQAIAVAAVVAAATWPFGPRRAAQATGLFAVTSLAFLSHVGVFPLLFATLILAGTMYRWAGGPALSPVARAVVVVAILAAGFSVVTYYGRFAEAYESLQRVAGRATAAVRGGDEPGVPGERGAPAGPRPEPVPRRERAVRALRLTVADLGWPLLLLAAAGCWRAVAERSRDRLSLMVVAVAASGAAFVAFSVAAPVEPRFLRYADEFISRVHYALLPAAAVLAARGLAWAWSAGLLTRAAGVALAAAALAAGAAHWARWLR